jgi:uncharacterized RDD family membrane protein YckC
LFCTSCGTNAAEGVRFCPACGARLAGSAAPAPPPPPFAAPPVYAPVMDYASWGTRALGYLIDSLLVGGVIALVYAAAGGLLTGIAGLAGKDAAGGMCCLLLGLFPIASLAVGLYNRVYLVALRGASIGQGIMHIKVVDASGNLLSQSTALIRLLAQIGMSLVPLLPILDMLWPLWDERKQTLHDKAVSCYVINNPQR